MLAIIKLLIMTFLLGSSTLVWSDERDMSLIAEFIRVSKLSQQIEQQILFRISDRMGSLKSSEKYKDLPEEFFLETEREIAEVIKSVLMDEELIFREYADIYSRFYSDDDISNLIAFYKTPTGQKVLNSSSELTLAVGQGSLKIQEDLIIPQVVKVVDDNLKKYSH